MKTLADLFAGLLLSLVLLAGLFTFITGVTEPEKRGALAISGAILLGCTMITLAIMARSGDGDG